MRLEKTLSKCVEDGIITSEQRSEILQCHTPITSSENIRQGLDIVTSLFGCAAIFLLNNYFFQWPAVGIVISSFFSVGALLLVTYNERFRHASSMYLIAATSTMALVEIVLHPINTISRDWKDVAILVAIMPIFIRGALVSDSKVVLAGSLLVINALVSAFFRFLGEDSIGIPLTILGISYILIAIRVRLPVDAWTIKIIGTITYLSGALFVAVVYGGSPFIDILIWGCAAAGGYVVKLMSRDRENTKTYTAIWWVSGSAIGIIASGQLYISFGDKVILPLFALLGCAVSALLYSRKNKSTQETP